MVVVDMPTSMATNHRLARRPCTSTGVPGDFDHYLSVPSDKMEPQVWRQEIAQFAEEKKRKTIDAGGWKKSESLKCKNNHYFWNWIFVNSGYDHQVILNLNDSTRWQATDLMEHKINMNNWILQASLIIIWMFYTSHPFVICYDPFLGPIVIYVICDRESPGGSHMQAKY